MFSGVKFTIALLLMSISLSKTAFSDEFVFAVGEWAPFVSSKLPFHGAHGEIVTKAFEVEGHSVSFKYYPWRRSMELTKTGAVAATFSWIHTEERSVDLLFPEQPVGQLRDVYYYRKDRFPEGLTTMPFEELQANSLTVVGIAGYSYEEDLRKAGVVYQSVSTEEQAWRMLYNGHADILIDNDLSGDLQKRQFLKDNADEVTRTEPYRSLNLYIMFSRSHPDAKRMMEIWDRGILKLRSESSGPVTQ